MKTLTLLAALIALGFIGSTSLHAQEGVGEGVETAAPESQQASSVKYSSEFTDAFELDGDFEVEIVDEQELFTAVGEGPHTVIVILTDSIETLDIPAGATVGWRFEDDDTFLLSIDGDLVVPLPWTTGTTWPGQPQTYASGTWVKVTYHGTCFLQTVNGYNCGKAGKSNGCQARVYVPNGDDYLHTSHCGSPGSTVRFLGGSVDINF